MSAYSYLFKGSQYRRNYSYGNKGYALNDLWALQFS